MKKWVPLAVILVVLVAWAATVPWLLPPLMKFAGAHSDEIAGMTGLVQLVLWIGAAVAGGIGWWRGANKDVLGSGQPASTKVTTIQAENQSIVAADHGVAAKQVAVGGDVHGDVILVANPELLWNHLRKEKTPAELQEATKEYLKHVVDRYRYLDFRGMGVTDRVPLRLPLIEMYVPLKARI